MSPSPEEIVRHHDTGRPDADSRVPGQGGEPYELRVVEHDTTWAAQGLRGMVSLDRVGVGERLVVSSAGAPDRMRAELLAAAERAGAGTDPMTEDRASDHWSFVRDGLPGGRLGSAPYVGYHSPDDVPSVVDPAQVARAARTVVAWLR